MPFNKTRLYFARGAALAGLVAAAPVFAGTPALSPSKTLAALAPAAGEGVAAPSEVALHKALYELEMVSVKAGSGIVGIKGTMYFDQGDSCDAYTTDQRFTMEYQYPERRPVNNTNHYVSWESKDGNRFEFNSERQENGRPSELLRGSVVRAADGSAEALYSRPGDLKFALPAGYVLPVAHTSEIVRRARLGQTLFNATLFDGTDSDGPVAITVIIGKKATPEEIAEYAKAAPGKIDQSLLVPEAWHVRMAIFPLKEEERMSPAYEMDMVLHANGVVSRALVDYKTFKVEQRLKTIERVPAPKC